MPKPVEAIGRARPCRGWIPLSLAEGDPDSEGTRVIAQEWVAFHHAFRHCFARSEPQRLGLGYLAGLLSDTAAKSAKSIALEHLGTPSVRALQRFMTDAP